MGFRCPVCSKDFGTSRGALENHAGRCCSGAALDVIKFVTQTAEESEEERCERCVHQYCMGSTPGGQPYGPGYWCDDLECGPE